jgi:hypothetical protein
MYPGEHFFTHTHINNKNSSSISTSTSTTSNNNNNNNNEINIYSNTNLLPLPLPVPLTPPPQVGRRLCSSPLEDHWSLRDYCAKLVAQVCSKFGSAYRTLQPRVTKTLTRAFLDPKRPLTTHFGAIKGLHSLGQHVTQTLILPHLPVYLKLLEAVLSKVYSIYTM